MIDHLIDWSVRRRWLVIAAGGLLAVLGAWSALVSPVDAIPDLSENQVIVSADWPGHPPLEVDAQVAGPLSASLRGIRGVRDVRSSSDVGYAWLSIILDDSIPRDEARRSIAERLANSPITLPQGVTPRLAPDSAATGQIFWYTVEGGGLDPGRLRSIQDGFVRGQLASVPGVAEVASVGGWPIELQVELDPDRLREHGLGGEDVLRAVERADAVAGGHVLLKGGAEYAVRASARLGQSAADANFLAEVARELERAPVPLPDGGFVWLSRLASVSAGPGPRRGSLEKDGNEAVGGVVLMAQGENPREVTSRLKRKIREIGPGLPPNVRIVPFYDRTPLIDGAVATVSGTVVEAMVTATICVLLILLHLRASIVIAVTLPLAALSAFAVLGLLRWLGLADIEVNTMSLAGIAISIGVLVDSSIVVTENVMHRLRQRFGDDPVSGDVRPIVASACREVGRPIFFSVLIMLLSFLPVLSLGGIEGKMFRPLAITKCLALATVAVLAVSLVPAMCGVLLRGRIRGEDDSPVVRPILRAYRPVLTSLLDRPAPLVWILAATAVLGAAPVGNSWLFRLAIGAGLLGGWLTTRSRTGRLIGATSLILLALSADRWVEPLGRQFLSPLDEGMVMDMPITVPRTSISRSTDDLKARDMVLCRFPEVAMVVGKTGRAETATDPAPPDMIETMVELRPRECWPRREMTPRDALRQARAVLATLAARKIIDRPNDPESLARSATEAVTPRLDAILREHAYQRYHEADRTFGHDPLLPLSRVERRKWAALVREVDRELIDRAAEAHTRLLIEHLILQAPATDPELIRAVERIEALRLNPPPSTHHHHDPAAGGSMSRTARAPSGVLAPPILEELQAELSPGFSQSLVLWRKPRETLLGFGGDLDRAVSMPGWTNVWTLPIQNRVDMLATGVNTAIGVRVLGRSLDDVVDASNQIAELLRKLPGAADVVADPLRGKGAIDVQLDRDRAASLGVDAAEVASSVELAIGGKVAGSVEHGRDRFPIRVRYARDFREDEESVARVLVRSRTEAGLVPIAAVAGVRVVEGPATVKAENGVLRNYVRLNLRGRSAEDFIQEARRAIAEQITLPPGAVLEWTGQFEHQARARNTLAVVVPAVLALILLVLFATFRDWADAFLILLSVPGAIAGGVIFQWLTGEPFSVTVWVGYIAGFGMAAATGVVMLVYLRDALEKAGGLETLTPDRLRQAVIDGAVQRLRPKLLTEGTTILGLAPILWASGVGSEVIRPMAAPVIGGLLVADEVIDLLIPILFYRVRLARLRKLDRLQSAEAGARMEEALPSPSPETVECRD